MALSRNEIIWLLSAFDKPAASFFECYYRGDLSAWKPTTREEIQAFAQLTAPENRQAVKEWYSKSSAINPGAEAFRAILERAVGEKLPLRGEKANDNQ
jgi:hypothetical protein